MKKITVTNIKTLEQWEATLEDETEWVNLCLFHKIWGKPERWVKAKVENIFPQEIYSEEDVLERKSEQEPNGYETDEEGNTVFDKDGSTPKIKYVSVDYVLLKQEYIITIIELETDYDYLLAECHKKRRAEYPSITECADALYHKEQGDSTLYNSYIEKCRLIKEKYPLPIKNIDEVIM